MMTKCSVRFVISCPPDLDEDELILDGNDVVIR
jgi:hypothetical protein